MVMWEIVYSRQAIKDAKKVAESGLKEKVIYLLGILEMNLKTDVFRFDSILLNLPRFDRNTHLGMNLTPLRSHPMLEA